MAVVTDDNLGDLPRPLRLMYESSQRFWNALESGGDAELAASEALREACDAAERMAALAAPFDAFDVLESVR